MEKLDLKIRKKMSELWRLKQERKQAVVASTLRGRLLACLAASAVPLPTPDLVSLCYTGRRKKTTGKGCVRAVLERLVEQGVVRKAGRGPRSPGCAGPLPVLWSLVKKEK